MRHTILALVVACTCALRLADAATPFSVDASDLWYNPAESGWGVNLAQQGDTAFLTLYVYGSDGKPTWYVASAMLGQKTSNAAGDVSFTGDLYATTGPAFSGAFNPNAVVTTRVGTAVFDIAGGTMGTFTYTVNGTRVVKQVVRQTWRENDASGNYIGYLSGSCATTANGPEESLTFTINQSTTSAFFMNTTGTTGVSCGYNGTYSQDGRLGHAEGTVSCTNGKTGTFVLDAIEASTDGLVTHLTTKVGTCTLTSRLAGIRR